MLVNKYYKLPSNYEPDDLVTIESNYGHYEIRSVAYEIIDTVIEASEQAADEGLKFRMHTDGITVFASRISNIDSEKFRTIVSQVSFNESIENRPLYILGCLMTAAEDKSCSNSEEQKRNFIWELESVFK